MSNRKSSSICMPSGAQGSVLVYSNFHESTGRYRIQTSIINIPTTLALYFPLTSFPVHRKPSFSVGSHVSSVERTELNK